MIRCFQNTFQISKWRCMVSTYDSLFCTKCRNVVYQDLTGLQYFKVCPPLILSSTPAPPAASSFCRRRFSHILIYSGISTSPESWRFPSETDSHTLLLLSGFLFNSFCSSGKTPRTQSRIFPKRKSRHHQLWPLPSPRKSAEYGSSCRKDAVAILFFRKIPFQQPGFCPVKYSRFLLTPALPFFQVT